MDTIIRQRPCLDNRICSNADLDWNKKIINLLTSEYSRYNVCTWPNTWSRDGRELTCAPCDAVVIGPMVIKKTTMFVYIRISYMHTITHMRERTYGQCEDIN